jgi:hypothetical protein
MLAMNRCPTVAEAIEILEAGVPEADRGGKNETVAITNADFSDGSTGWDTVQGTPVYTDGTVELEGGAAIRQTGIDLYPKGVSRLFRIKAKKADGSGTTLMRVTAVNSSNASDDEHFISSTEVTSTYQWYEVRVKNEAGETNFDRLIMKEQSGVSGRVLVVDEVQLVGYGLTADLPPSSLQLAPGLWLDESGNGGHPVLPDGMRIGEAKTEGVLFAENEFTASAVGQPICADVPVLPADCQVILMMKASVSGDFNIGDEADPDRYAAGVTIGTGWAPVALSEHASDGTNRKIVVTPTASYSGVVSTKVKVERLV